MSSIDPNVRQTGIASVGAKPWGTHSCQFSATAEDLTAILVPYFKAGLEADEFCIWITSPPFYALPEDRVRAREVGFDRHLAKPPTMEMLQTVLGGLG